MTSHCQDVRVVFRDSRNASGDALPCTACPCVARGPPFSYCEIPAIPLRVRLWLVRKRTRCWRGSRRVSPAVRGIETSKRAGAEPRVNHMGRLEGQTLRAGWWRHMWPRNRSGRKHSVGIRQLRSRSPEYARRAIGAFISINASLNSERSAMCRPHLSQKLTAMVVIDHFPFECVINVRALFRAIEFPRSFADNGIEHSRCRSHLGAGCEAGVASPQDSLAAAP